ncbi:MAG: hypothetical protein ACT6Q3_17360 [Sphingopyxis sp.]
MIGTFHTCQYSKSHAMLASCALSPNAGLGKIERLRSVPGIDLVATASTARSPILRTAAVSREKSGSDSRRSK